MRVSLVVTFCGIDRPGIVDRLSQVVADHGGNWEESQLARLAGRFAGLFKTTIAPDAATALKSALSALSDEGLVVTVARGAAEQDEQPDHRALHLQLTGADHEGIVHDVAHVLADRGINIDRLTTDIEPAPMSGDMLFSAKAELSCPPHVSLEALQQALEQLADDLVVDITLHGKERGETGS